MFVSFDQAACKLLFYFYKHLPSQKVLYTDVPSKTDSSMAFSLKTIQKTVLNEN